MTGFGSSLLDINDSGNAIRSNATYNYLTDSFTPIDADANSILSINNNGDLIGNMPYDVNGDGSLIIEQPGYKKTSSVWTPMGYFTGVTSEASIALGQISENGVFITGQMSIDCCHQQAFLYNTTTSALEQISNPVNEYSAGYTVNNTGILGGWYDPQPSGTLRVPAFMTTGSVITDIPGGLPVDSSINQVSAINNNNLMVGDKDNRPFMYNLTTNTFTQFNIPAGYDSATFTSVSDNGIAVGYCQKFGFVIDREAIIYHPSIGNQPVFLRQILASFGITAYSTLDGKLGTAIAISPNGNFISGWENDFFFFAHGWLVNLDNLLFTTCFIQCPENITTTSLTGPKVVNYPAPTITCSTHPNATLVLVAGLASGSAFPIGTTIVTHNLVETNGDIVASCSFNVIVNDTYCPPIDVFFIEPITLVNINNINNASDVNSTLDYEDFTNLTLILNQGETVNTIFKGTTGGDYTDYFTAFIDWNLDGEFDNINERYELGSITNSTGTDSIQTNASFNVPVAAPLGDTTIRIVKTYDVYAFTSCEPGSGFGQVEDYKVTVVSLATNEFNKNNFKFYPNPVNDVFTISNDLAITNVSIYTLIGQEIKNLNLNATSAQIDISNFPTGTYIVKATSENSIYNFKLIKN